LNRRFTRPLHPRLSHTAIFIGFPVEITAMRQSYRECLTDGGASRTPTVAKDMGVDIYKISEHAEKIEKIIEKYNHK